MVKIYKMYKKGKDIKVPFDCLWHCMTRSFQVFLSGNSINSAHSIGKQKRGVFDYDSRKPEDFEKW